MDNKNSPSTVANRIVIKTKVSHFICLLGQNVCHFFFVKDFSGKNSCTLKTGKRPLFEKLPILEKYFVKIDDFFATQIFREINFT